MTNMDRLIAKRRAQANPGRALAMVRVVNDKAKVRAVCLDMRQRMGMPIPEWMK